MIVLNSNESDPSMLWIVWLSKTQMIMTEDFEIAVEMFDSSTAPASIRDAMAGRDVVRFQIVTCFPAFKRAWARAVPILPRPRREVVDDMMC